MIACNLQCRRTTLIFYNIINLINLNILFMIATQSYIFEVRLLVILKLDFGFYLIVFNFISTISLLGNSYRYCSCLLYFDPS